MSTDIQTISPQLSQADAVDRTRTVSLWRYLRRGLQRWLGADPEPNRVSLLYYPNYIAYTTVTIPRRFASDRVEKFLGGIDGMTTHTGVIDFELPARISREVTSDRVLSPEILEDDAQSEWRDWVFEYASREYRPIRRPDFGLDSLELLYIPYWVVEFEDAAFAVNSLTKAADPIETHGSLAEFYQY